MTMCWSRSQASASSKSGTLQLIRSLDIQSRSPRRRSAKDCDSRSGARCRQKRWNIRSGYLASAVLIPPAEVAQPRRSGQDSAGSGPGRGFAAGRSHQGRDDERRSPTARLGVTSKALSMPRLSRSEHGEVTACVSRIQGPRLEGHALRTRTRIARYLNPLSASENHGQRDGSLQ